MTGREPREAEGLGAALCDTEAQAKPGAGGRETRVLSAARHQVHPPGTVLRSH